MDNLRDSVRLYYGFFNTHNFCQYDVWFLVSCSYLSHLSCSKKEKGVKEKMERERKMKIVGTVLVFAICFAISTFAFRVLYNTRLGKIDWEI